jgi:hypothetical protein
MAVAAVPIIVFAVCCVVFGAKVVFGAIAAVGCVIMAILVVAFVVLFVRALGLELYERFFMERDES